MDKELLELNELREQMQMLRNDLDQQIQVNEELMMQQLKKNSNLIKTNGTGVLVAAVLAIYPIIIYSQMYGLTRALTIVSIAVLLIDGFYNYWITHLVKDDELSNCHIGEVLETMLTVKRITRAGVTIELVTDVVMILWISYETIFGPRFPFFSQWTQMKVIIGLIVGILLGFLFAFWIYRRHTKAIDEMVEILNGRLR